ncbi:MAG: phosphoribosylglycinamide formyltransferase [Cyclobacteriaceae bacterium]|nr:phosphoribosylglycinamide formyltransferase [Cyclobacteriaceae bacterium]
MVNIVIFASGSGSNAGKIMDHFKGHPVVKIVAVLTNNPKAGVIERAKQRNTEVLVFDRNDFYNSTKVADFLEEKNIDIVVLAGFLWLVPAQMLGRKYDIINIHPALLPKYGGAGMYGKYVHEAVKENNENFSGITIHYVNKEYDRGEIIFQKQCELASSDTPLEIAAKVLVLEHQYYPRVIEDLAVKRNKI